VRGFFDNGGTRMVVCRIAHHAATCAEAVVGNFILRAVGPGSWGRRVYFRIADGSATRPGPDGTRIALGFRLLLGYFPAPPAPADLEWFDSPGTSKPPPYCEVFDDLETDPESPNHWRKRLEGASALADLSSTVGTPATERPANQAVTPLGANGSDGAGPLDVGDFEGADIAPGDAPRGLAAIEGDACREVALVYSPGASAPVSQAVIAHCERMRYRFAVVDAGAGTDVAGFEPRSVIGDTAFAALYLPWIAIRDPQDGVRKLIPPGGHVLGVYARTDANAGVAQAPANEILEGVIDLAASIDNAKQATLAARGINAIRSFPDRGIRVWGARTLSSDAQWKYVSVRRLFIFLERSIDEGTQWVVFEPNDERLWARVRDTVRVFLRAQWRLGPLAGQKEEEAFFVSCDRTTMTQDDIRNGRLICEIGIAAVRPAEFVVLRIFQRTKEASN
jgi:phage tail sheath protein FI